jgi:glycosyltransferase involved in cell wall biosynthesis
MKITVLWSSLASYSVAFFKELVQSQNCELQLIYNSPTVQAPYKNFDLSFCKISINRSKQHHADITKAVSNFSPDSVLMSSWNFPEYMKITKKMRSKGVVVVSTIDHQWKGTLKQWLGVISSRWFLKPSIDGFMVTGDRQAFFARKLGYDNVIYGLCAAAVEEFTSPKAVSEREPNFLFVGRLSEEKGIENLMIAYGLYREDCRNPWGLKIAGTGKLRSVIDGVTGVTHLDFVQPADLPKVMESARALILPSKWEPWGVVIHEAAAAGLPIIATFECGAVTSFVHDGINGYIITPHPLSIADAMMKMTSLEKRRIDTMGKTSQSLAGISTPQRLAYTLVENLKEAMYSR